MVRVLIVDDSGFMRNALKSMLQADPEISIVGTAKDGQEAIEKIAQLHPDVVTMDVEMPRMDGLTALKHIMERQPVPVIMVSAITVEGAQATLTALELGAVDFIPKNLSELAVNIVRIRQVLIEKVKAVAHKKSALGHRPGIRPTSGAIALPARSAGDRHLSLVAIGSSTGGPKALQDILPRLPSGFPVPVVIAQHMPPSFTKPFAERLNQLSQLTVKEAEDGEPIRPGIAYVAPGNGHMHLSGGRGPDSRLRISQDERFIYRPSVDCLMQSVADVYPGRALGVILTGMGNDGVRGMAAMKRSGCRILAQDEDSCIVYGMPKAVVDAGIADKVVSLTDMAGEIVDSI